MSSADLEEQDARKVERNDEWPSAQEKVAVLVDGAFYKKRAKYLFGDKTGEARADELCNYCRRHLRGTDGRDHNSLYRIFYYDCPPISTNLWHPLKQKTINMEKTEQYAKAKEFLERLSTKRKVAIRLGELQEKASAFKLKDAALKDIWRGNRTFDDMTFDDFELDLVQKGVDMRIGLDIASLAHKGQVTQIVLIAGDSDFVPAAKYARREGIDFILDPMRQAIRPELNRHIDGLNTCTPRDPLQRSKTDELCVYTQEELEKRMNAQA